jgi:hypothetical protein
VNVEMHGRPPESPAAAARREPVRVGPHRPRGRRERGPGRAPGQTPWSPHAQTGPARHHRRCRTVWHRPRCERRLQGARTGPVGGDHCGRGGYGQQRQQEEPHYGEARTPRPAAPEDVVALVCMHDCPPASGRARGAFTQMSRGDLPARYSPPPSVPGRTGKRRTGRTPGLPDSAPAAGHGA